MTPSFQVKSAQDCQVAFPTQLTGVMWNVPSPIFPWTMAVSRITGDEVIAPKNRLIKAT